MNTQETANEPPALALLSPLNLALGLSALSLVVMVISTCSALSAGGPLPPPREPPPPLESTAVLSDRFKQGFYQGQLDDDCKKLKIRRLTIDMLKGGNPYAVEHEGTATLRPGRKSSKLDTPSLRLRVLIKKLLVGEEGRGMRAQHLMLKITNRTDKFLAYRVSTKVAKPGSAKADLAHNAIALKPKESVLRSETLMRSGASLKVLKVEVLELTRLGYHYVSRLDPLRLQFDQRTANGHQYEGLPPCRLLPWRVIKQGLRHGTTRWYDVVDFYSRHSCSEYTFFAGYRWSAEGVKKLPAKPLPSK